MFAEIKLTSMFAEIKFTNHICAVIGRQNGDHMKKIIAWTIGVCLFAGMIAGATAIYDHYLEENKPSNIVVLKGDELGAQGGALPPFLQQGNGTGIPVKGGASVGETERRNTEATDPTVNETTEEMASESKTEYENVLTSDDQSSSSTETQRQEQDSQHLQSTSEPTSTEYSSEEYSSQSEEPQHEFEHASLSESENTVVTEEVVEDSFEHISEEITEKATETKETTEKVTVTTSYLDT